MSRLFQVSWSLPPLEPSHQDPPLRNWKSSG
uniref:Uncharacterized protein n=1 Tax=Rhizophora mucronata TaxID=61149 RepID=A0A2P2J7P7_RHIMU